MIEALLAVILVFTILAVRAYRQNRRPLFVDGVLLRRHGRVVGVKAKAIRRGYSPLFALLAVFGMALPRGGFTSAGVPVDPTVPKVGTTTAAGNVGGTTLIDTNAFTETSDTKWEGALILILSGSRQYELRAVHAYDHTTSTITVGKPFTGQVASGTKYALLSDLGEIERILGANNANNAYDSSLVVANADGSTLERLEYVASIILGNEPVTFSINSFPGVDEDGGRFIATVSIVDRNSGKIASGSIDITGVTYALKKSTGDAAFSTAGVTQPAGATKATGRVDLEFAIVAGEWASGDSGQLELDGITATVGGTTYYSGVLQWPFTILETLDVKTAVDAIKVDTTAILADTGDGTDASVAPGVAGSLHGHLREVQVDTDTIIAQTDSLEGSVGTNADASTDPSAASGTLFSKLRGAGDNLDTIIAQTDSLEGSIGTNADASTDPSAASGTLFSKIRGAGDNLDTVIANQAVPAADSATNTLSRDAMGAKDDTALASPLTAAVTATASAFRYLKTLMARTIAPSAADNATAAGSASLYETTGRKDDASVYAKSATATQIAYVKALVDAGIAKQSTSTSAGTTTVLNDTARTEGTNYWQGQRIFFLTGVNAGLERACSASTQNVSLGLNPALPNATGNGDSYAILPASLKAPTADDTGSSTWILTIGNKADARQYETAAADSTQRSLVGLLKGLSTAHIALQSAATGAGAADGSTIVDSGLTSVNFAGHKVMMVSGTAANLGVERVIQSISGTTLTVAQPFPAATANTDKYAILADATNKNLALTNAGTNNVASGGPVENTIIDQATPIGGPIQVFVDLNALTVNATIKLYRKIDNTTYRIVKTYNTYITGTSDPGFYTDPFYTRNGFKLTITPAAAEGAARTCPWEILGNQGA